MPQHNLRQAAFHMYISVHFDFVSTFDFLTTNDADWEIIEVEYLRNRKCIDHRVFIASQLAA